VVVADESRLSRLDRLGRQRSSDRKRQELYTDPWSSSKSFCVKPSIANNQKMAVAERREAEPTTQHRNEVGLAVRQATIVLLAESCRQLSCKPINVSCRGHAEPLQPTMRIPEIVGPLARA